MRTNLTSLPISPASWVNGLDARVVLVPASLEPSAVRPGGSCGGEPGLATPTRGASAAGATPPIPRPGPGLLDGPSPDLASLADSLRRDHARDRGGLASGWVPGPLAMEVPSQVWEAAHAG